jgi:hypothetical protein
MNFLNILLYNTFYTPLYFCFLWCTSALVHRIQVQTRDRMPLGKSRVIQRPGTTGITNASNFWTAMYLNVTFHWELFYDATWFRTGFGFRSVFLRCRAFQQFLAGDLLVRSLTVTHSNTQETSILSKFIGLRNLFSKALTWGSDPLAKGTNFTIRS